jgi:hypothetical protein
MRIRCQLGSAILICCDYSKPGKFADQLSMILVNNDLDPGLVLHPTCAMAFPPCGAATHCRDRERCRWRQVHPLGVIGADGLLEQFLHVDMEDDAVRAIGELPKGRCVLGALIEDPRPIRLEERLSHPVSDQRTGTAPHRLSHVPPRSHRPSLVRLGRTGHDDSIAYSCVHDRLLTPRNEVNSHAEGVHQPPFFV